MITALLTLAIAQAPALPPGVSPEFSAEVFAIEQLLEAGKFEEAAKRLSEMPTSTVSLTWDDSAVPAESRAAFAQARDQAFVSWKTFAKELTFEVAPNAPLSFRFVPGPQEKTEQGIAKGMVLKFARPALEASIGLTRGAPVQGTTTGNIQNDVFRAIGAYLGIGDSAFSNTSMSAIHWPANRMAPMKQDIDAALANLKVLDALRAAAREKQIVKAQQPKFVLSGTSDLGQMMQGEKRALQVQMKNEGTAPVHLWVKPDCGCITVVGTQTIAPGETKMLQGSFDSTEFEGDVAKKLIFITNDPKEPVRQFDLKGHIKPMFRMLAPAGAVAVIEGQEGQVELFLTFKDMEPFGIRQAGIQGLPGKVSFEPWEGVLSDPQKGEGPVARKGYRIVAKISGSVPPGRNAIGLVLQTNSPMHPIIQHTIYAQKGIVALPDQLNWGEVAGPKQAKLIISRPGKKFTVTGVESSSPNFRANFAQSAVDEATVEVAYDGKGFGDLAGTLTVKTDDPKQPTVIVPIIGRAK